MRRVWRLRGGGHMGMCCLDLLMTAQRSRSYRLSVAAAMPQAAHLAGTRSGLGVGLNPRLLLCPGDRTLGWPALTWPAGPSRKHVPAAVWQADGDWGRAIGAKVGGTSRLAGVTSRDAVTQVLWPGEAV